MNEKRGAHELVVGEGWTEERQDKVREFLLSMAQLLSVSRFHQLDNEAITVPVAALSEQSGSLCANGEKLLFHGDGGQVFVNRHRMRFSSGAFAMVELLLQMLQRRGLAGLEFRAPLPPEHLHAFLASFQGVPSDAANPADHLEKALAEAGVSEIALVRPGGKVGKEGGLNSLSESALSSLLYAKAVVILRETFRNWENEEARRYLGARATRVIQQMITLAQDSPRPFLWLIQVKSDREYIFTHGANVALLSILMGLRLGLDRNSLCQLSTAALFHDMGHLRELCGKSGSWTREEEESIALHPVHGVNLLLGLRTLNEALLKRLIVVFECNIQSNGYPRKSWPPGLHLFSRIVAIAKAYDAMTTQRSFRSALAPDEAIREISEHSGSRYDADLARIFINMMGIYPLGTLIEMDTGEWGLVFHVDSSSPRRPLVKLVQASDGTRLDHGEIVDLGERDANGAYHRNIVGTGSAVAHGFRPSALLWEGSER